MILRKAFFTFALMGLVSAASFAQDEKAAEKPAEAAAETQEKQAAEEPVTPAYDFTVAFNHDRTDVKNQGSTGTCWCFATASFLESELLREGKGEYNISEMFIVKNIYMDKAFNFVHRNGKANFSEGALSHDFIRAASRHGLVPEEVYDGLDEGVTQHSHGEMVTLLEGMLTNLVKKGGSPSKKWDDAFRSVVDAYLGKAPTEFNFKDKSYTPKSFAESLEFDAKDYVNLTSFNHHPFGEECVLEIPDNFSSGSYLNVPIDQVVATIDHAIENGFTVAWDGDVSERTFNRSRGLAIMPANPSRRDAFRKPGEEVMYTQEMRQETFESHSLTDDHLMHLTGIAHDNVGNKYYIIKNSWGTVGEHDGYLYMSEAYVRAKTIAITLHKDGVPKKAATKPQASK
jgi:bleomycin hydrolase